MYITLGNIDDSLRNKQTRPCWRLLATLPNVPKRKGFAIQPTPDERNATNARFHEVLEIILQDIKELYKTGMEITCGDGKKRIGHPVLAAWIADIPEYNRLFSLKRDSCLVCEVPKDRLGDHPKERAPLRDTLEVSRRFNRYFDATRKVDSSIDGSSKILAQAVANSQKDWLNQRRHLLVPNKVFDLPGGRMEVLWRPDILHMIYQGVLEQLFDWILEFIKTYKRVALFDQVWASIPNHPSL